MQSWITSQLRNRRSSTANWQLTKTGIVIYSGIVLSSSTDSVIGATVIARLQDYGYLVPVGGQLKRDF